KARLAWMRRSREEALARVVVSVHSRMRHAAETREMLSVL
ncbi:MAG: hypothetical protein DVB28_002217, partial [Verrucomicrobia bacterium]